MQHVRTRTRTPTPFSARMPLVPSFDVITFSRTPQPTGFGNFASMCMICTLTVPFADIHEASNAKLEAERQLNRLTDHQHHAGFNLKPNDPRVVVAEQHLAKLVADQRRLNDRNETRSAAWRRAGHTLVNVETWLERRQTALAPCCRTSMDRSRSCSRTRPS